MHDYFLYDWHDKEHVNIARLHGFRHPNIALKNAEEEYELSDREKGYYKEAYVAAYGYAANLQRGVDCDGSR